MRSGQDLHGLQSEVSSFRRNESQTHWRWHVEWFSSLREASGLLIDLEDYYVSAVLIRNEQPLASGIDFKIPRRLSLRRKMIDESEPAGSLIN